MPAKIDTFDNLIFEVNCLGCGKVAFSLPYREGTHHTMTCHRCGEVTIAHVLKGGHVAVATLEQRDSAVRVHVEGIAQTVRNSWVQIGFVDASNKYKYEYTSVACALESIEITADRVVGHYRHRTLTGISTINRYDRDYSGALVSGTHELACEVTVRLAVSGLTASAAESGRLLVMRKGSPAVDQDNYLTQWSWAQAPDLSPFQNVLLVSDRHQVAVGGVTP